jgi:hypothetical protein
VILLDAQEGSLHFQSLTEKVAQSLELSPEEWDSYESELEELNLVVQSIGKKLAQEGATTPRELLSQSEREWNTMESRLSPPTWRAIQKIALSFAQ